MAVNPVIWYNYDDVGGKLEGKEIMKKAVILLTAVMLTQFIFLQMTVWAYTMAAGDPVSSQDGSSPQTQEAEELLQQSINELIREDYTQLIYNEAFPGEVSGLWLPDQTAPFFEGFEKEELKKALSLRYTGENIPAVSTAKAAGSSSPGKILDGQTVTLIPLQRFTIQFYGPFTMKNSIFNSDRGMITVRKPNGEVRYFQDSVVRITPAGKLTAIGLGTTHIAAASADGRWIRGFTVTVTEYPKTVLYLNRGEVKKLKFYRTKPSKMIFATSDPLITGMVNGGIVSGNNIGAASVVGLYDPFKTGKGFAYGVFVFVEDPFLLFTNGLVPANKALTHASLNMFCGQTSQILMGGVYHLPVYRSSNPGIVTVNEAGMITAIRPGNASITARINGKTFTVSVRVQ